MLVGWCLCPDSLHSCPASRHIRRLGFEQLHSFVFVICRASQAGEHSDTACALVLIGMMPVVVVSMLFQHCVV